MAYSLKQDACMQLYVDTADQNQVVVEFVVIMLPRRDVLFDPLPRDHILTKFDQTRQGDEDPKLTSHASNNQNCP